MSSSSSVVVVDCGSGYSRVSNFRLDEINRVRANKSGTHIRALHAIIHCPKESTKWLTELRDIVQQVHAQTNGNTIITTTKVLLGATGGVRDLVKSGGITATEIDNFRKLLAASFELPFQAELLILSGEEEANYEFVSANYCANECGLVGGDPTEENTTPMYNNLGLLSSGGMSSQILVQGVSHSLATEIKRGNKLGLDHGMEHGKAAFYKHAQQVIARNLPERIGGENELYLAIEMFAAVGEKAGMGGVGAVPVAKAIETLSTFIEQKTEEDRILVVGEGAGEERTWKTYVHVMSGIVAKLILEKLHPDSNIVFAREFEIGKDHVLKPSWPLGHAVEHLLVDCKTIPCAA